MENKAIILAAGRGSRMKEHTETKPKCLTELAGKTLLDWQIEALRKAGIEDVYVVRGYRSELINRPGLQYIKNERWAETNMVASLFCFDSSIREPTIISYSDIVYHKSHIEELKKVESDITITADKEWFALWKLRFENPFEDAETFITKDGRLNAIGGKTHHFNDIEAQYMGLIKLSPKGWGIVRSVYDELTQERKDNIDMTSLLNLLLEKGVPINVVYVKGQWCEVDSYDDVLCYERELNKNPEWAHDWR
ncbi:phosphocholine cytidylyltransferase family protein [Roseivirga sp. UBA1976]|uniref:phosphocholine cytidylyltransferase family protein n=1 Tax=Roseivirga sp. UBA1976 TaxID=1947386 RepID=UPI00257BB9D0|nr:phosphocholine cytidylyltransferase family protein [Roseivirga sp. UBA1976]|tara:strand:- start:1504 stop:2256 length:753 start_codon:yes stop_codon:yes gene_type:complete